MIFEMRAISNLWIPQQFLGFGKRQQMAIKGRNQGIRVLLEQRPQAGQKPAIGLVISKKSQQALDVFRHCRAV